MFARTLIVSTNKSLQSAFEFIYSINDAYFFLVSKGTFQRAANFLFGQQRVDNVQQKANDVLLSVNDTVEEVRQVPKQLVKELQRLYI
jgi:hypothetical protein